MPRPDPQPGLTPRELARRLRVGTDKVRAWIESGELAATNTAASRAARPRYIVLPVALERFLASRQAAAPAPTKRKKRTTGRSTDYFPD